MVFFGAWRRRLALLGLLVAAVFALAAVPSWGDTSSPWDVPAPPISDSSTWSRDPVWQRAQSQSQSLEAAQQSTVSSSSAAQERDRSATQFDDLSRPEAQELAQQTFPDLMAAPLDALGLPDGDHVTSYLSPTEASVSDEHGKHYMLVGSDALAAKDDGSSTLSKVDLSLSADQGALVPNNPSVDVTLPDSAADPLTLPDSGLSVSLASGADVAGRVQDDRVFYGEVSTDTDYITVPRREGAQVMWQLRSPQATESPSVDLGLPAGEHARLTSALTGAGADGANPSVEIVKDDNTVVDTIQAPMAMDADNQPVPARYRLDGDRLYVDVPHREQQVRYPVMVDPMIYEVWGGTDWQGYGAGTGGVRAGQWGYHLTTGPGWLPYTNVYGLGPGLFIESAAGNYTTDQNAYFQWGVPAYVNISNVWFDGLYHQTEGDHLFAGIAGPYGWETIDNIGYNTNYEQSNQTPNPAWETASAVIGVWEDMSVNHPIPGWVGVRGVRILLGDTTPPDVALTNYSVNGVSTAIGSDGTRNVAPWVSTNDRVQVGLVGADAGLGLQYLGVFDQARNWVGRAWTTNCNGTRAAPCPSNTRIYFTQDLPAQRGYSDLSVTDLDIEGNLNPPRYTWRERVDGDNPLIKVSGDVYDHRSDGTLGYNPTVRIDVNDDPTSSLTAPYNQSGVSRVDVYLDGSSSSFYTWNRPAGCNDDCDASFSLTLPVTTAGQHRLSVVARDGVGHLGNNSDPADPTHNYLPFTVGPEVITGYGAVTDDLPEDATDNASNADQLPLATGSGGATTAAADPVAETVTSGASSSYDGVSAGGATASAAPVSNGCTVSNPSRDGLEIQRPRMFYTKGVAFEQTAVLQEYKQNRAAFEQDGNRTVTAKQFILCGWAGEQTYNGYKVKRENFAFYLRTSIPRLLTSPSWSTGITNGQTSTTMGFGVNQAPVAVSISHSSTGDGKYDGTMGESADVKTAEKYLRTDLSPFTPNIVNAFWQGDSPDYHAPTGAALYEMPQSARNPGSGFAPIVTVYCSKIFPFRCRT